MSDSNATAQSDTVCDSYCQCSICTYRRVLQNSSTIKHSIAKSYCLQNFLDYLPRNFPIAIVSTAFPKIKAFYYNKFGNRLMITQFTKIAEHFPLITNVVLFYQNKSLIAHKYQLMKEDPTFSYIQGYSSQIPINITYHNDQKFMDDVLEQKLPALLKDMTNDEYFNLTERNKQFLIWAHQQYKDQMFCKYMTKLYCAFIKQISQDKIISAQFQWIVQKLGFIRLSNVKNLIIQKSQRTKTFQQQYQQKILEKLKAEDNSIQSAIFNAFVGQSKVGFRVSNFRNQIRQIFQKQKLKILQKTQKQRTVQTKSLSDDIARLFLPQLHKFSSLRQVLNDETKFKKVVLGMQQKKSTDTTKIPKRPARSYIKSKSLLAKHHRSKTQS